MILHITEETIQRSVHRVHISVKELDKNLCWRAWDSYLTLIFLHKILGSEVWLNREKDLRVVEQDIRWKETWQSSCFPSMPIDLWAPWTQFRSLWVVMKQVTLLILILLEQKGKCEKILCSEIRAIVIMWKTVRPEDLSRIINFHSLLMILPWFDSMKSKIHFLLVSQLIRLLQIVDSKELWDT